MVKAFDAAHDIDEGDLLRLHPVMKGLDFHDLPPRGVSHGTMKAKPCGKKKRNKQQNQGYNWNEFKISPATQKFNPFCNEKV